MKKVFLIAGLLIAFAFIQQANAGDVHKELKNYFNNIAVKVKNTSDVKEKREILNNSFKKMLTAIDEVEHNPLVSKNDIQSLSSFKGQLQQRYDELNGLNGFQKVKDNDLNNFADYSVQAFEQSAQYITISIVTLLLIVIIALLI
jgi:septal ring factor EnvC (AmiA/AmiB activator)